MSVKENTAIPSFRQNYKPFVRSFLGSMPEFANIGNESTHSLPLAAQFPPRVGQPYISGAPVFSGFSQ
jgi:hypothetical protein